MKFLFVAQGEGRGHTTQAIALKELVQKYGHTVARIMVGTQGDIPHLVQENFSQITPYKSPAFTYSKGQQISWERTVLSTILSIPSFVKSMWSFRKVLKEEKPDVVVNFYEPLFGLYNWLFSPATRVVAIGHQFMFLHPKYKPIQFGKPPGFGFLKAFTRLAGAGAEKLALSFYAAEPDKGVTVVPPLLRKQIFELNAEPKANGLVITYLINPGYLHEFISESNAGVPSRVYTKVSAPEKRGSVEIVPINGEAFIRDMSCAGGVCCTAGFETVAEAMYLGVPLLMRPIEGHGEQRMNAQDAYMTIPSCWPVTSFKAWPRKITSIDPQSFVSERSDFRTWVNSSEAVFARLLKLD